MRTLLKCAVVFWLSGLLFAALLVAQDSTPAPPNLPKVCADGLYLTVDGRCLKDRTGETSPAGDGCNVVTCLNENCRVVSVTTMYCGHGDDPASSVTAGTTIGSGLLNTVVGDNVINSVIWGDPDFFYGTYTLTPSSKEFRLPLDMRRKVAGCQVDDWQWLDPVCTGYAVALAKAYMKEHPELFVLSTKDKK